MLTPERLERLKAQVMARANLRVSDFESDITPAEFLDRLVDLYHSLYPSFTIDELLVRPREALRFCDAVRQSYNNYDLPDDVILRPLLNKRKSGT